MTNHREPHHYGDEPIVSVRSLRAGYGSVPVVHGVDLDLRPGQVVALLGPNGAGKTTTLRAIAGQIPAVAGDILFDGVRTRAPLHRRVRLGMAYIPENRAVFRTLSCRDNLRLGSSGLSAALAMFPQLVQRLDVPGGLLSGGEQQMVGLARALSRKPRLIIADELSLGLAPLVVDTLLAAIRSAADEGAAVLLVEQHVRKALSVSDFAYVMRRGSIELSGTSAELLERVDDIERTYLSLALQSEAS
ncbi:branched-chain amino acid ABC transporter ATP-binding protein [Streptomyces sp. PRh5]|uniref:ABC transporter ATP-binding protein n=1 Tax=Streptomyces sp. PRh5 TaxID=1158056 RepID=UPI000446A2FE|nr:ABC transporter ATP-binding protein [Streptomyces sp. PRh5]EXU64351.1 branched-chain amino acid ABC transporter ATP-binding protein [Streptomyces sp. PRh5]